MLHKLGMMKTDNFYETVVSYNDVLNLILLIACIQ